MRRGTFAAPRYFIIPFALTCFGTACFNTPMDWTNGVLPAVQISPSAPLVVSTLVTPVAASLSPTLPSAPLALDLAASGSGLAPVVSSGHLLSTGGLPTNAIASLSGTGLRTNDATLNFTSSIGISIGGQQGGGSNSSLVCGILSSGWNTLCQVNGFSVPSAQIQPNGLQIMLYQTGSAGIPAYYSPSNAIPTAVYAQRQVTNLVSGYPDVSIPQLVPFKGMLYFVGNTSASIQKLMATDGTTIEEISNTFPGVSDSPSNLTIAGNYLFFTASAATGQKLFMYDGASVSQVTNLVASGSDNVNNLTPGPGGLYFVGFNSSNVAKVYFFDGKTLTQISNTSGSATISDSPSNLVADGNALYFVASNASLVQKVFRYGGGQLTQIPDTSGSPTLADAPMNLTILNGNLYFIANNSSAMSKVFRFDGTNVGQITDTTSPATSDGPTGLSQINGMIYFFAFTASAPSQAKLFRFNPSTMVTSQISNTDPSGSDQASPGFGVPVGNLIYATMLTSPGTSKVFAFDGSTFTQISNTDPTGSDGAMCGASYGGKFYFVAENSSLLFKLFVYDGGSISQISSTSNAAANDFSSGNCQLLPFNNKLYFVANDLNGMAKLFSVCDESLGCTP